MTTTVDDLRGELEAAFGRARTELVQARLMLRTKDTPEQRAAVRECRARIDGVLDLYLGVSPAVPL
jgi:hypothetical protein